MFQFDVPAAQDDFSTQPDMRRELLRQWNDKDERYSLARYTDSAAEGSVNYVDPRVEPPAGNAVPVSWNGFPQALSRWYLGETGDAAKRRAEETADILTPMIYWAELGQNGPELIEVPVHHLPYYVSAVDRNGAPLFPMARFVRFPRRLLSDGSVGDEVVRYRRQQDEYLEWHATKDDDGTLRKIAYVAEAPDYWFALAQVSPKRVVQLYQQYVSDQIVCADLFHQTDLAIVGPNETGNPAWVRWPLKGTYDELNRWTTTDGIMHLTHAANTLGAEVNLAGDAARFLASDRLEQDSPGADPIPQITRIACGRYGGINRSSDPLIGHGVGRTIRGGNRLTLTDPVGLYVGSIDVDGLEGPNGESVGRDALHILRGEDDAFAPRILRFEIELPDGRPFGLQDCRIDGRALERGGQIARLTTLQLYATAYPDSQLNEQECRGAVCSNPENQDLFLIGGVSANGPVCPNRADRRWLLISPYEGPGADAEGAAMAADAGEVPLQSDPGTNLAAGSSLSASRAPLH